MWCMTQTLPTLNPMLIAIVAVFSLVLRMVILCPAVAIPLKVTFSRAKDSRVIHYSVDPRKHSVGMKKALDKASV